MWRILNSCKENRHLKKKFTGDDTALTEANLIHSKWMKHLWRILWNNRVHLPLRIFLQLSQDILSIDFWASRLTTNVIFRHSFYVFAFYQCSYPFSKSLYFSSLWALLQPYLYGSPWVSLGSLDLNSKRLGSFLRGLNTNKIYPSHFLHKKQMYFHAFGSKVSRTSFCTLTIWKKQSNLKGTFSQSCQLALLQGQKYKVTIQFFSLLWYVRLHIT